jgi:threonine dehydratase
MTLPNDNVPKHRLSLENIARLMNVIDPVFLNSPQYNCEPLSEALGCAKTIADGIAVRVPIPEAVSDRPGIVDDALRVDDAHLVDAMRLCYSRAGVHVEPAGAAGLAGVVAHREMFAGQHVATILCGSNLTEPQIKDYFE